MATKKQNSHTSTRAKKAASKALKPAQTSTAAKKKDDRLKRLKKLEELTLRAFRMAYESNQRGEFRRL